MDRRANPAVRRFGSGANIAGGRFTDERKALLRSSRVGPTRLLSETLARLSKRPRVLVSASALGYYGDRGDAWVVEADPPANDFLGRLSGADIYAVRET